MSSNKSSIIQKSQEISQEQFIIDHRSIYKQFWDNLQNPLIPLVFAIFGGVLLLVSPAWFVFVVGIFLTLRYAVLSQPDTLPINLPLGADKPDLNDPKPGLNRGHFIARGAFYIGVCRRTGREFWASLKALTQHWLTLGTTGAGKTEALVSDACCFLSVGSATAFNDAKAAPKAMFQMATICRIFGRDLDFRVTNYITSLNPASMDPASRTSNDSGIFARGTADTNTQLVASLIPSSNGDNKLFSERAIALLAAIMPGLNDLRNLGIIRIDPGVIRKYMGFNDFVGLCHNNFLTKSSRDALVSYLVSLSGYDEAKPINQQPDEVMRQFGFAQAYFTRALASLSDTYGHIYLTGQGEIDYQDAVLNGRVLMTLLPSLSKSGDELANLGKIVLTAIRNGMVVGLGTVFEGSAEQVVHNLPTNSDVPYGIQNDENAYMMVEGQEMMNAQARGLGFSVSTGTQDSPGMLLSIEKTTKQIFANSAFKRFMYLDDEDTTKLACELSGEANVLVRNGYRNEGSLRQLYASDNVSIEKRYRLSATAIRSQDMGQAFLMYKGLIHEVQVFNHGIQEEDDNPLMCYLTHWWPVRMAKVHVPRPEELEQLIRIQPLPDWVELSELLQDDSKALLREMKIYFSSMLAIQRINARVAANPELRAFAKETAETEIEATGSILADVDEPADGLTGVLQTIQQAKTETPQQVVDLFARLAKDRKGPERLIQEAAEQSGIGDFLSSTIGMDFAPQEDDTSAAGGSSGGGGQGIRAQVVDTESAIHDFLTGDGQLEESTHDFVPLAEFAVPQHHLDASTYFDEELVELEPDFASRDDKSHLALAVEQNLPFMPWMVDVVDYSATRSDMISIEAHFNGGDLELAEQSVDEGIALLANQMQYPTTNMANAQVPDLGFIRSLLQPPRQ